MKLTNEEIDAIIHDYEDKLFEQCYRYDVLKYRYRLSQWLDNDLIDIQLERVKSKIEDTKSKIRELEQRKRKKG